MSGAGAAATIAILSSSGILTTILEQLAKFWPQRGLKKPKDLKKAFNQLLQMHQYICEAVGMLETNRFLTGYVSNPTLGTQITSIVYSIGKNLIDPKKTDIRNLSASMEPETLQLFNNFCTTDPSVLMSDQSNDDATISSQYQLGVVSQATWTTYFS